MPYLTPPSTPEERDCRALLIPASTDWLALFGGALTELSKEWNWEQQGITVDEALTVVAEVINGFYAGCMDSGCTVEGGYRVIRITRTGDLEQWDGENWQPVTDEYVLPPPAARTGGTTVEQICLAAANAINVLHELYNNISDSFNDELTEAEALAALIALIITLIGVEVAPISFAIAQFFLALFSLLFQALRYLTADLWTEDFEKQMICFLVDCASNSDGVVTFDWQCFNDHLNTLANDFGLSEVQLRLYIQVGYLLYFMGGAAALNLAGATTAITSADCSECEPVLFCRISDWLVEDDGYESGYPGLCPPYCSNWVFGEGWRPTGSPAVNNGFQKTATASFRAKGLHVNWKGSGGAPVAQISMQLALAGTIVGTWASSASGGDGEIVISGIDIEADQIIFGGNNNVGSGTFAFTRFEIVYEATDPILGEDNCP